MLSARRESDGASRGRNGFSFEYNRPGVCRIMQRKPLLRADSRFLAHPSGSLCKDKRVE